MILGVTGTREGLTDKQMAWLVKVLDPDITRWDNSAAVTVHHGACVGADAAAHALAIDFHHQIHVWPPTNTRYLAVECVTTGNPLVTIHPSMPYLDRDREIVKAGTGLIALPKQNEQPDRMYWGGTWYTVNFAERLCKPVVICYPNGVVEQRFPDQPTRGI